MKLFFTYVGHKKDGKGKNHLWGILTEEVGPHTLNRHIFWGAADSRIYLREMNHFMSLYEKRVEKENRGYRKITQQDVEKRWPEVMVDIEMQFIVKRLSNGN